MHPTSITAIFCEDIREEKNGILSLIGVMPDNVNWILPSKTHAESAEDSDLRTLSKLCVYIRVNFDPDRKIREGNARILLPDGSAKDAGHISADLIRAASQNAKSKGNPMAGIVARIVINGFSVKDDGSVRAEVTLDEKKYLAGVLNFKRKQIQEGPSADPSAL